MFRVFSMRNDHSDTYGKALNLTRYVNGDCPHKTECPYLGRRDCDEILAELDRLKTENRDLRGVFDMATKAFKEKEDELLALRRENEVLRAKFRDLAQRPFAKNTSEEDNTPADDTPAEPEIPRNKPFLPT